MKKLIIIFALLSTFISTGQNKLTIYEDKSYFSITTEVDVRNAIGEGEIIDNPTYNGTLKLGYTEESLRLEGYIETFPELDFFSGGVNAGVVLNKNYIIQIPLSLQIGLVDRPYSFDPSFGFNIGSELHLDNFIFVFRGENRWIGHDHTFSGFVGVSYKIFN